MGDNGVLNQEDEVDICLGGRVRACQVCGVMEGEVKNDSRFTDLNALGEAVPSTLIPSNLSQGSKEAG